MAERRVTVASKVGLHARPAALLAKAAADQPVPVHLGGGEPCVAEECSKREDEESHGSSFRQGSGSTPAPKHGTTAARDSRGNAPSARRLRGRFRSTLQVLA